MAFSFSNLDADVRKQMLNEVNDDVQNSKLYQSKRLSPGKENDWIDMLREAVKAHDESWLANEIRRRNLLVSHEQRATKNGTSIVAVPATAPETLAEGEFNRFYARGLCRQILAENGSEVEVYRGKPASSPRVESQALIGKRMNAKALLADLRSKLGVDTAMGLPPGPNSGLTIKKIT